MKKFGIAACVTLAILLGGVVAAQSSAKFTKDKRLVQQWFADNAHTQLFIDWAEANLTQPQITAIEAIMFPEPEKGQKQVALELMKLQMQQMNMEKAEDTKALYDSVAAALEASKTEVVKSAPVESVKQ